MNTLPHPCFIRVRPWLNFLTLLALTACTNVQGKSPSPGSGPTGIANRISNEKWTSPEKQQIAIKRWQGAANGAKNAERPVPILATIETKHTALLVIDMQRAFLDKGASLECPEGRSIIPRINKLADAVRKNGGTVIFFRYMVDEQVGLLKNFETKSYLSGKRESPMTALSKGNPQFEISPELDVRKDDMIMDKTRYSAVFGSDIVEVLREKGIENVILTGVSTDACVGNTAEDLMQSNFNILMVWDGTAALDRLEHEIYLARIFGLYGDVMPADEVISRLK